MGLLSRYSGGSLSRRRDGNRVKILHVIESLGFAGGAERRLVNDVTRLRDRFSQLVVHLFRDDALAGGLRQRQVPTIGLDLRNLTDGRAITRLSAVVRRFRPDVIHTQLFGADIYGRIVGRCMGIPVVSTAQASVYDNPEAFHRSAKRRLLDRWTARFGVRRMVAVSAFVGQSLVRDLGLPPQRIEVIPNSVDPEPFERVDAEAVQHLRRQLEIPTEAPVIVTTGKLLPPKGHALGLAAIRLLRQRVPEVRWLVAGEGPCRLELEERVRQWGLQDHVRLLGVRQDIPELLALGRLFVFPSTSAEGLPMALLEAMAAGRACIGFDAGPVPEVIAHGQSGLVVEPRSPEALASAMQTLLADPERCQAMGQAGRARVYERFHADQAANRLAALYLSMVSPCRPYGSTDSRHDA